MEVIKRDGREVDFNSKKIFSAILHANSEVEQDDKLTLVMIKELTDEIVAACKNWSTTITIEEIQEIVESTLMTSGHHELAKRYIRYRYDRGQQRKHRDSIEKQMMFVLDGKNKENANANVDDFSFGGRKFETANIGLKDLALNHYLPKRAAKYHNEGRVYIHDLDFLAVGAHNCLFIDFQKLLKDGFTTRNGDVRPPKSVSTAMQQVAVIMQCQSQVQFGGVASAHIDFDLAPFVKMSFKKHYLTGMEFLLPESWHKNVISNIGSEYPSIQDSVYRPRFIRKKKQGRFLKVYNYAMKMTERECLQAAQGLYHNLNTLESRAGSQLPFTSINYGRDTSPEGRMITKSLIQASIDGIGKLNKTAIFPIAIFQHKKGVNANPGDPNYDLKQLAIKSLSKRIYPNFVNCDWSQNIEDSNDPDTFCATMGCRTALGKDRFTNSYSKVGRGNIAPHTIILPKLGLEYGIATGERDEPDIDGFFKALDDTLEVAEEGLLWRFKYIASQNPKAAPFMYLNGTMRHAEDCDDTVYEAMKHGSLAIGMIGLAETLTALVGKNQTDDGARELGKRIVKHIYDYTQEASERNNLNFSCYFTPAENLCYTSMQKLKKEFGEIPNVTSNEYLTNSIHVPVWENISIFEKLNIEKEFTKYGTAGCITYVEFDAKVKDNQEALETVINYGMENDIPYLAINFPIDTCLGCGYAADIPEVCPKCGDGTIEHLARVTGYLTTDVSHFNKGKQAEVKMRYKHSKQTNFGELE